MRMISNAIGVAFKLRARAVAVDKAVELTIYRHGLMMQTRVMRNASGRPGPNTPTGDYRRSITTQRIPDGVAVGTNSVQGRRLEFGFTGADSLGRVYDQPPYPHFGPALEDTKGPLIEALKKVVGDL